MNNQNKEKEEEKEIEKKKIEERKRLIQEEDEREKKNLEKYRIDYLSFKTSLPNTKIKSICPMCSEIPDIYLSLNSEQGHYVKCVKCRYCYCCSHPRAKTLDDYISIMVKIHQENIKCDIHKEKGIEEEGYFSCEYCQKWMCEECINKHINEIKDHRYYVIQKACSIDIHTHCPRHNKEYKYYATEDFMLGFHICELCNIKDDDPELDIISIPKEKGGIYLNQLKIILNKGVEYLDIYCKNLYNKLICSINNNQELLKDAKKIYDNFLIRNRRVLFYYQMVINTATPSYANYNLIKNISSLLDTKFEKIDIPTSTNLKKDEIEKIFEFFENSYIVGEDLKEMKNIKDFNIKEISNIKYDEEIKNKNNLNNNDKKDDKNENEKISYNGIILLEDKKVCCSTENGYIHIFEINKETFEGKNILSQKAHEKNIICLDNIKNTSNRFVTLDNNYIKIWNLKISQNNYKIEIETVLKKISEHNLIYLYVLNNSNNISFIDKEHTYTILDSNYCKCFNYQIEGGGYLQGLYQIESKDENNGKFIIGKSDVTFIIDIFEKNFDNTLKGYIKCGCFTGKSFYYLGNNKLIIGNDNIYIADIKNFKLENIIKIGRAEITCFLNFNDKILCGYGDTSHCHSWIGGIACDKTTKFCVLKRNNEKYESILISDEFYDFGITNSLCICQDKFISCFYDDNNLKVFKIK